MSDPVGRRTWYLEGFLEDGTRVWRTPLRELPFRVGRRADSHLPLRSELVSMQHAEFVDGDDCLLLRDLSSKNGTFVNGHRVQAPRPVAEGDIIHFADLEFRLVSEDALDLTPLALSQTVEMQHLNLHRNPMRRSREFRTMLQERTLAANFQPILRLANDAVIGFEVLGRGFLDGKDTGPQELFSIAEVLGLEVELSRALREKGTREAHSLPGSPLIFLNTHPEELRDPASLLASLTELKQAHPTLDLVIEIHETAVTDVAELRHLRTELAKLGIGIAFDDFGTGQARLLELTDVSPQFLKFDRSLVHRLHEGARTRREMVETLVHMVLDLGIAPLAEGVECREERDLCEELGFQFVQGYLFGSPSAATSFS